MKNSWFAAWECNKNEKSMKMSGVFHTKSNVAEEAYDEVKAAILGIGDISDLWIVSFNKI
jgi:hypothetical protein